MPVKGIRGRKGKWDGMLGEGEMRKLCCPVLKPLGLPLPWLQLSGMWDDHITTGSTTKTLSEYKKA